MDNNNAHLKVHNPFLARRHQANKYHRNKTAPYERPGFNRSIRYIQKPHGASNATSYIPRSLGTPENRKEFQRFHHRPPPHSQPVEGYHRQGEIPGIDEGFSSLSAGDNDHALKLAEEILRNNASLSRRNYLRANLLKARALLNSGLINDCLRSIEQVKPPLNKWLLMTKGKALQGKKLMFEALLVFKDIYKNHSIKDNDKRNNYLTLGIHYQRMGEHQEALTIFIKLRTDLSGHEATPCNDKKVELALGRLYQSMGLQQKALTIFIKLRSDRSGHEGTPCNDKEIELALGDIHVDLMNWRQFDQMQLDKKGFAGPEVDLCISIRYFRECIYSGQSKEIPGLLAKAIEHGCNAIEKSQYLDASPFSQLGHCLRIAALLPVEKTQDCFSKDELKNLVSEYFTEANKLHHYRQDRLKTEDWRKIERTFLARLPVGLKTVRE